MNSVFRVVFIHGPPAVGKYTIATHLSAISGLPLFHNHLAVDTAKSLFAFGTPSFNTLRASIWRSAFEEAARVRRSFIFTFNPEASVEPSLIERLLQYVRVAGGQLYLIELRCRRETLLQRLNNPSRAAFGKLTDPSVFAAIEAQNGFDFPPLPTANLMIDTDHCSAELAAQKIAQLLVTAAS